MAKKLHVSHVKSNVLGKAPSASVINYGELAVNYNTNSPALFIKDSSDGIVKFAPQSYVDNNFVYDAEYYSSGSTHEIRLYDASGTTIATINANDFIKDGMVHDVYITGDTMVITFNTDAGHEDIKLELTDIFDPGLYYTKSEVDEMVAVDSELDTGSTNPVQNRVVYQYMLENELVIAEALNDLNTRKADKTYVDAAVTSVTIDVDSVLDSASTNPVENRVIYDALNNVSIDVDDHMDSASTNPVENRVIWKVFHDDEKVTAAALNDLNDNKADKTYVDAAICGVTIEVDDHLDTASTKPVENRVIANALGEKVGKAEADTTFVHSAEFVSTGTTPEIVLMDANGTPISTIDATEFVKDGMVDDMYISGSTLVVEFNADANKQDILIPLETSPMPIDPDFDSASTHPVENRAIYNRFISDRADIFYGTCGTAAATTTKTVVCNSFTSSDLKKGALIFVTFSATNTGAVGSLTLNVNGTGAKAIKKSYTGTAVANLTNAGELKANVTYLFTYDGTNWVCITLDYDTNTTYSEITEANIKSATSSTAGTITGRRFRAGLTASTATELSETSRLPAATSLLTTHANTTIPDTAYTSSQIHLPAVTADDNGKTLRVVNGEWALVSETNVYSGSGEPSQSLGEEGDIYLQTS